MKIGVYPGSFDPFTEGHMDVLRNAVSLFDVVYVGVLNNAEKRPTFTPEERVGMIRRAVDADGLQNVVIESFGGLLVDYARRVKAEYLIRGLRAITDFEYEYQIDAINRHLAPSIRSMYFMASPEHSYLSSSIVKEIASYGGSIEGLVPACNTEYIIERVYKK